MKEITCTKSKLFFLLEISMKSVHPLHVTCCFYKSPVQTISNEYQKILPINYKVLKILKIFKTIHKIHYNRVATQPRKPGKVREFDFD